MHFLVQNLYNKFMNNITETYSSWLHKYSSWHHYTHIWMMDHSIYLEHPLFTTHVFNRPVRWLVSRLISPAGAGLL